MNYEPVEVGVALSLYGYNVSPVERARKLHDHFEGDCADPESLVHTLTNKSAHAMTELAPPTAEVYVIHALEEYGQEARERVRINRTPIDDLRIDLSSISTSLRLDRSSWENLFSVIKLCVPVILEPDERKTYLERTGKEWTIGDFWDSVKELQKQLGEERR